MHPLIRQYAAEHLGEDAAALTRHSHYYLTLLGHQEMRLRSPEQGDALALMGREIENVRQAWEHAISQADVVHLEQGGPALYRFYDTRGWLNEGETAFRNAAAALQTHFDGAATMPDAAAFTIAWLWGRVAWFHYQVGQVAEARQMTEQSLAEFVRLDARIGLGGVLSNLSSLAHAQGDYASARRFAQESITLLYEIGNIRYVAYPLSVLARVARDEKDFAAAQNYFREALQLT